MEKIHTLKPVLVFITFVLFAFCGFSLAQKSQSAKVALGSKTAKEGFKNETEIAAKLNNWQMDGDARVWLSAMNFKLVEIESVAAMKPHGEKADVQVKVRTKAGEFTEGISIKLVSSPTGFNQIDKRWLATYAKMWKMPADIVTAMKLFLGETKPNKSSRNPERMFLNELDPESQKRVVDFFTQNKESIVSDIFEGDGVFAAKWILVALKSTDKPRWTLRSTSEAIRFFAEGPVVITKQGSLKIGRITMQRKGGDGGRDTAKMLQFKINPVQLFDAK